MKMGDFKLAGLKDYIRSLENPKTMSLLSVLFSLKNIFGEAILNDIKDIQVEEKDSVFFVNVHLDVKGKLNLMEVKAESVKKLAEKLSGLKLKVSFTHQNCR